MKSFGQWRTRNLILGNGLTTNELYYPEATTITCTPYFCLALFLFHEVLSRLIPLMLLPQIIECFVGLWMDLLR